MSIEFQVTLRDIDLVVTDDVQREPNRIDIVLSDVIAIADVMLFPRRVSVTSISPPRGRDGTVITIVGTGFSDDPTRNRVTFNGLAATVLTSSESVITATAPFFLSFINNAPFRVEVETPPFSGRRGSAFWWVKLPEDDLADEALPVETPGPGEDVGNERPQFAEATDWQRLTDVIALVLGDGAGAAGTMAHDGVGPVPVVNRNPGDGDPADANDGQGQVLVVDPGQPSSVAFGWLVDVTLPFGGQVVAAPGAPVLLRAHGNKLSTTGANSGHGAQLDGTLDLVWLLVKEAGADTLDRVRVLVNSAQVFDSGAGLGLVNNQVFSARMSVAVLKEDLVEVEVTKAGVAATMQLVGGVRLELR